MMLNIITKSTFDFLILHDRVVQTEVKDGKKFLKERGL